MDRILVASSNDKATAMLVKSVKRNLSHLQDFYSRNGS